MLGCPRSRRRSRRYRPQERASSLRSERVGKPHRLRSIRLRSNHTHAVAGGRCGLPKDPLASEGGSGNRKKNFHFGRYRSGGLRSFWEGRRFSVQIQSSRFCFFLHLFCAARLATKNERAGAARPHDGPPKAGRREGNLMCSFRCLVTKPIRLFQRAAGRSPAAKLPRIVLPPSPRPHAA